MSLTDEILLSRTITDKGRVALVKKKESNVKGRGGFAVWCSTVDGMADLNYKTFDEAFASYEQEIAKLY